VWFRTFDAVRCGQDPVRQPQPPTLSQNFTAIEAASFKLQMNNADESDKWVGTAFTLRSDGILASAHGSIDVKQTIGVWIIGPPGWRRLQIVNPDTIMTLASDDNAQLEVWALLLQDVSPGKHVNEMRRGWMEKRGVRSGLWKQRFFVLLSTHELLVYTSEASRSVKSTLDVRKVKQCRRVTEYADEGYDYAFVLEGDNGLSLTVCVDEKEEMREWMAVIERLMHNAAIQVEAAAPAPVAAKKGKQPKSEGKPAPPRSTRPSYLTSTRTSEGRYYLVDENGHLCSTRWASEGGSQLDAQHNYQDRRRRTQGLGRDVVKVGWLHKCSQFDASDWKKRYYVLRSESSGTGTSLRMSYYDSAEDAAALWYGGGSVELSGGAAVRPRPDVKTQGAQRNSSVPDGIERTDLTFHMHCFEIETPERSYLLSAPSAAELNAWVAALPKA